MTLYQLKWADRIERAWANSVDAILETARLIGEARGRLDNTEWRQLIDMLSFSLRWAQMLVRISTDMRLAKHASFLPSDTYTLYQLTRLTDGRYGELIENGTISPSMKRNEASAETRKESKEADEQRVLSVKPAKGKHRTLIFDPPWDYEWLSLAGRASPGYATMSHE